jgi:hypothetical protein
MKTYKRLFTARFTPKNVGVHQEQGINVKMLIVNKL